MSQSFDKNAFQATGTAPHLDFDFKAVTGDKLTWAPKWGFVTSNWSPLVMFKIGGSFGGFHYGVQGYAGYPAPESRRKLMGPQPIPKIGPELNEYTDFAGVFGTGVYVGGVAGTSVFNIGVYGQAGEDPDLRIPQKMLAGVFGAATTGSGVVGWSTKWNGVEGYAYEGNGIQGQSVIDRGVFGVSDQSIGVMGVSGSPGPSIPDAVIIAGGWGSSNERHGVIGTSNAKAGVYGYSTNYIGIVGATGNPSSYAGRFFGSVGVTGTLTAAVKNSVVPFPDGSQRLLHCMESPEHWFEDFGSAKLARGRAVVKIDANFAKVIKRGDYRVFLTPEGDCQGLYVRRKSASSFEVRELTGGKSSVAFSYRIVGRRKDIKEHRRFAKIDMPLPLPTRPPRAPRKPVPTAAGLRAFVARVEKEAREQTPKGAEKARARMRRKPARPPIPPISHG